MFSWIQPQRHLTGFFFFLQSITPCMWSCLDLRCMAVIALKITSPTFYNFFTKTDLLYACKDIQKCQRERSFGAVLLRVSCSAESYFLLCLKLNPLSSHVVVLLRPIHTHTRTVLFIPPSLFFFLLSHVLWVQYETFFVYMWVSWLSSRLRSVSQHTRVWSLMQYFGGMPAPPGELLAFPGVVSYSATQCSHKVHAASPHVHCFCWSSRAWLSETSSPVLPPGRFEN